MPIKATIFNSVPADQVPKRVIPEFRTIVDLSRLGDGLFTIICFPGMKSSSTLIVDSKTLTKALNKIKNSSEKIVVVAHGFTKEAFELIHQNNIIAFFQSDFYWSDESWANIRDF